MKQRIRITAGGIYGADGEIPIGSEFDVNIDGDDVPDGRKLPEGWATKYVIVGEGPKDGAVALTNKNKAELLEIAAAEGVTLEDGTTNDDIKAAIELAREAK